MKQKYCVFLTVSAKCEPRLVRDGSAGGWGRQQPRCKSRQIIVILDHCLAASARSLYLTLSPGQILSWAGS